MKRFEKTVFAIGKFCLCSKRAIAITIATALVVPAIATAQQSDQALLDRYLSEIERLISGNDLEGARDKLAEATSANLEDTSNNQQVQSNGQLTEQDKLAAMDLLDSLRVAMENGELGKVQTFSEATPRTNTLLTAVFDNYSSLRIKVSEPEPDNETESFLATLEFTELTMKDGNKAFPAQGWKTHRLRIIKSDGRWQKVLW